MADRDALLRVAHDLDRLGLASLAVRVRAALDYAPPERVALVQDKSGQLVGIPWGLHEMLHRVYADHGHGGQSAEEIHGRRGFSRSELGMLAVGSYDVDARNPRGRTIPLLDLYNAAQAAAVSSGGEADA